MAYPPPLVWVRVDAAALEGAARRAPAALALLDSGGNLRMIVLLHPRSTRPKNRRFPLSVLALGAVLEGKESYEIVDGNIDPHPMQTIDRIAREQPIEMLGVS